MEKLIKPILIAALLLVSATLLQAQSGCTDSPENPTVIFGIITAAVSYGFVRFGNRFRK